jgi:hypothetical protein
MGIYRGFIGINGCFSKIVSEFLGGTNKWGSIIAAWKMLPGGHSQLGKLI